MSVSLVWLRRLPKEEIAARVAAFRAKLSSTGAGDKDVPKDEFGRVAWVIFYLSLGLGTAPSGIFLFIHSKRKPLKKINKSIFVEKVSIHIFLEEDLLFLE